MIALFMVPGEMARMLTGFTLNRIILGLIVMMTIQQAPMIKSFEGL